MTALSWCTIEAVLKDQNSRCTKLLWHAPTPPINLHPPHFLLWVCVGTTQISVKTSPGKPILCPLYLRICHYIGSHRSLCCIQAAPEQHCLISVPTSTAPPFLPTHWDPPALFCIVNDSCHQWAPKGPLLVESYAANPHTLMFLLLEAISP